MVIPPFIGKWLQWYDMILLCSNCFIRSLNDLFLESSSTCMFRPPQKKTCHLQHDTIYKDFRFKWQILQRWWQRCLFPFPHLKKKKTVGCCIHYHPNLSCSKLSTWDWWLEKPCNEIGCDLAAIRVVCIFHDFEVTLSLSWDVMQMLWR